MPVERAAALDKDIIHDELMRANTLYSTMIVQRACSVLAHANMLLWWMDNVKQYLGDGNRKPAHSYRSLEAGD